MYDKVIAGYRSAGGQLRKAREDSRDKAKISALKLADEALSGLNVEAVEAVENQRLVNGQCEIIAEKVEILHRKSEKFVEAYRKINAGLKEVGDLVALLESIEGQLEAVLR